MSEIDNNNKNDLEMTSGYIRCIDESKSKLICWDQLS